MKKLVNILNSLGKIEFRYEEGWDYVVCGDEETDGFRSRLEAERYVESLQGVVDNLDSLEYWEETGRLAMVDNFGTKIHISDIKMDIDGKMWIDGETDFISFIALSSHEAIKNFITATDYFFDYCHDVDDILPISYDFKDEISSYTSGIVLQYSEKTGYLEPVDSDFLFEAIRKEAGIKSPYED